MVRKFFPLDKNYILERVQFSLEQELLQYLVDFVKVEYLLKNNPLGIRDKTADMIRDHESADFKHLHGFYMTLMGIFRYTYYHDNQLTFLFSGEDDEIKYSREWTNQFRKWTKAFCQHPNFLRAVLDLTVFYPADSPVLMVDNRMNAFITNFFELKIHPEKGIVRKMA